jgi:hypothetical protein
MDDASGEEAKRVQMPHMLPIHDLRTALSVVVARAQLLRRRFRRGDDRAQVEAELEALEAALVRLVAVIERLDQERTEEGGG